MLVVKDLEKREKMPRVCCPEEVIQTFESMFLTDSSKAYLRVLEDYYSSFMERLSREKEFIRRWLIYRQYTLFPFSDQDMHFLTNNILLERASNQFTFEPQGFKITKGEASFMTEKLKASTFALQGQMHQTSKSQMNVNLIHFDDIMEKFKQIQMSRKTTFPFEELNSVWKQNCIQVTETLSQQQNCNQNFETQKIFPLIKLQETSAGQKSQTDSPKRLLTYTKLIDLLENPDHIKRKETQCDLSVVLDLKKKFQKVIKFKKMCYRLILKDQTGYVEAYLPEEEFRLKRRPGERIRNDLKMTVTSFQTQCDDNNICRILVTSIKFWHEQHNQLWESESIRLSELKDVSMLQHWTSQQEIYFALKEEQITEVEQLQRYHQKAKDKLIQSLSAMGENPKKQGGTRVLQCIMLSHKRRKDDWFDCKFELIQSKEVFQIQIPPLLLPNKFSTKGLQYLLQNPSLVFDDESQQYRLQFACSTLLTESYDSYFHKTPSKNVDKIKDLKPNSTDVTLIVKLIKVEKSQTKNKSKHKHCIVADETGCIQAYMDLQYFKEGQSLLLVKFGIQEKSWSELITEGPKLEQDKIFSIRKDRSRFELRGEYGSKLFSADPLEKVNLSNQVLEGDFK